MKQLHQVQLDILKDLLFSDVSRYSDIKPEEMENSQFVFHLGKLIESGLIKKEGAFYFLTDNGKEYANQIDTDIIKITHQAKVTTTLCAVRQYNKEKEYLIYKRLKNPFFGCTGFPTEKQKWGETLESAATRGLKEETGLTGIPRLFAIWHYLVKATEEGGPVEDKLMYAYIFINPKGVLKECGEGNYRWTKEKDIKNNTEPKLEEFDETLKALKKFKGIVTVKEITVITSKF